MLYVDPTVEKSFGEIIKIVEGIVNPGLREIIYDNT